MNYKNLFSLLLLAVASVKADRNSSQRTCIQKNGLFLESPNDSSDTRYACLLPARLFPNKTNYSCGTYGGFYGCYAPELGNMDYCDRTNSQYHSRGCALGIGALWDTLYVERKRHQESKDTCQQKNGLFLEANDPNDYRYACFLPEKNFPNKTNYTCGTYGGFYGCYAPELGNMNYCDRTNSQYHSRGCALGVGALYNEGVIKRDTSRNTCKQKKGKFLENTTDKTDERFACILPYDLELFGDHTEFYCGGFNGFQGCYAPELGNMEYCNKKSKQFHSRGCNLGLGYLDS